jgi:hypothetical protein
MLAGSEMEWALLLVGTYRQAGMAKVFRDVFLPEDPGLNFSLLQVNFERFSESLGIVNRFVMPAIRI